MCLFIPSPQAMSYALFCKLTWPAYSWETMVNAVFLFPHAARFLSRSVSFGHLTFSKAKQDKLRFGTLLFVSSNCACNIAATVHQKSCFLIYLYLNVHYTIGASSIFTIVLPFKESLMILLYQLVVYIYTYI